MGGFRNILVGLDLSQCRPLQASALNSAARETITCATWLARENSARLLFLSVFNLSEDALHHLDPADRGVVQRTIEEGAHKVLDELVQEARAQDVQADKKLMLGRPWQEIVRQVLREHHDLVVVGTREHTGWRRMLFGNTALKLLRRCPCPVWVVKPGFRMRPVTILVATDLKPPAQEALCLGVALAQLPEATLHVLHVVEYPLDRLGWTGLPDATTAAYHQRVRAEAEKALHGQLAQILGRKSAGVQVHLATSDGVADTAIHRFLQDKQIDLLVMGTIARSGIAGIVLGNTAERLLPEVPCSVLAVKPADFQCPVSLT